MSSRLYWLMEKHQRITEALRTAWLRERLQWSEIARLTLLKNRVKQLSHRTHARAVTA